MQIKVLTSQDPPYQGTLLYAPLGEHYHEAQAEPENEGVEFSIAHLTANCHKYMHDYLNAFFCRQRSIEHHAQQEHMSCQAFRFFFINMSVCTSCPLIVFVDTIPLHSQTALMAYTLTCERGQYGLRCACLVDRWYSRCGGNRMVSPERRQQTK